MIAYFALSLHSRLLLGLEAEIAVQIEYFAQSTQFLSMFFVEDFSVLLAASCRNDLNVLICLLSHVSVWLLGLVKTEEKSNAITAIPVLR